MKVLAWRFINLLVLLLSCVTIDTQMCFALPGDDKKRIVSILVASSADMIPVITRLFVWTRLMCDSGSFLVAGKSLKLNISFGTRGLGS